MEYEEYNEIWEELEISVEKTAEVYVKNTYRNIPHSNRTPPIANETCYHVSHGCPTC